MTSSVLQKTRTYREILFTVQIQIDIIVISKFCRCLYIKSKIYPEILFALTYNRLILSNRPFLIFRKKHHTSQLKDRVLKHLLTSVSTHCFTSMGAPVMSSILYWMLVMDLSVLLMIPTIVTYSDQNKNNSSS